MNENYSQSNQPSAKIIGRILAVIFILATTTATVYYRDFLFHYYQTASSLIVEPCRQTITYRVSLSDSRFGISEERLRQAIGEAAEIWNEAAGRKLFNYEENGNLLISLVYDNRQAAADEQKDLNSKVESKESFYNLLKSSYDRAQTRYEAEKNKYEASRSRYAAEVQSYENAIRSLNGRGNITSEERNKYNAERDRLNAAADSLNKESASLKAQVDIINGQARDLNQLARELGLDIKDFNSIGEELGEFQEGVYQANGLDKQITIYQFDNYEVLVRVLAHELGHSLDLEHVNDPDAIMYKINQGEDKILKEDDLKELERACKF
ncbi:MAG: matrixin family metalloprotease [Patescibacteria group bacterium]